MANSRKIADRNRKRAEREARAAAGIPEIRQVDVSIVHALRAAIRVGKNLHGEFLVRPAFKTEWIVRAAMRDLVRKTVNGRSLSRRACAEAIRHRLTSESGDVSPNDGAPAAAIPKPARPTHEDKVDEAMQVLMKLA